MHLWIVCFYGCISSLILMLPKNFILCMSLVSKEDDIYPRYWIWKYSVILPSSIWQKWNGASIKIVGGGKIGGKLHFFDIGRFFKSLYRKSVIFFITHFLHFCFVCVFDFMGDWIPVPLGLSLHWWVDNNEQKLMFNISSDSELALVILSWLCASPIYAGSFTCLILGSENIPYNNCVGTLF